MRLLTLGICCLMTACSEDGEPTPNGSSGSPSNTTMTAGTTQGSPGTTTGGTSSSDSTASNASSTGASSGGATGATSSNGSGGTSGAGGEPGFTELGVCGQRGRSTVNRTDTFEGYEEFYIIGEEGFGDDICVVRFDIVRVGAAPEGCDQFAGAQDECLWTHLVGYRNPSIELDENGVCANSELGLDAEAIAEIEGSEVAYGFVSEYQGHNSVLLERNAQSGQWIPAGNATWDEETSAFRFDARDGVCAY
jgi:hypothetical protein